MGLLYLLCPLVGPQTGAIPIFQTVSEGVFSEVRTVINRLPRPLTSSPPDQRRAILRVGKEPRAASQPREPPIPSPSPTLIRPLDGESPGLEAAPTEQNALRATRRLIARIKCEVYGDVGPTMKWQVLNAEDAQIIEEDTEAQYERDLALFWRWHRKRGTDLEFALQELRRRTESHARELAEENGRSQEAGRDGRSD
jgi:hypothetical protein